MNNVGVHITTIQNNDDSIRLLAAQKQIYSTAKNFFYIQCLIASVVPVILSVVQIIYDAKLKDSTWIFVSYSILAVIIELKLERIVSQLKKTAASIQEMFDCKVLNIPYNPVRVSDPATSETIFEYSEKFLKKNPNHKLRDWYSIKIASVSTNIATVICQRSNCTYDFSIRKKYNTGLGVVATTTFIALLVSAAATDISFQKLLVNVIFPSVPIFVLAYKQYHTNNESIANLQMLRTLLETALRNATLLSTIEPPLIRSIQDKLYDNRVLSPLLPDWVFDTYRDELEAKMHFGVDDLIIKLTP